MNLNDLVKDLNEEELNESLVSWLAHASKQFINGLKFLLFVLKSQKSKDEKLLQAKLKNLNLQAELADWNLLAFSKTIEVLQEPIADYLNAVIKSTKIARRSGTEEVLSRSEDLLRFKDALKEKLSPEQIETFKEIVESVGRYYSHSMN